MPSYSQQLKVGDVLFRVHHDILAENIPFFDSSTYMLCTLTWKLFHEGF